MIDIESIKKEYEKLLIQLSDPGLISDLEKFEELSKRKKFLEKIIEKGNELEEIKKKIEEDEAIISAGEEAEMISLARTEISQLGEKEENLTKEFESLLLWTEENQERDNSSAISDVIVEIRAGTGGEEAALFAKDLYRMYSKYGKSQNWQEKILDSRVSDLDGFKEIIFELKNGGVFPKMKYEAGVHRVQRIPATEKTGRIHTSTATVAILPKPKKMEIKIRPEELKFDFYGASGPGGQYVQKRHTAVRITHLPTGLVVTSQTQRSQAQNRENAMSILEARLWEKKQGAQEAKISKKRKAQIGWAKRAEKIRTYNFPQNRLTDHRIKKSWQNLEEVLEGKLDSIIKTLRKSLQG